MNRLLYFVLTIATLAGAVALSRQGPKKEEVATAADGLKITSESRNPWSHLRLNNNPDDFQFAVVSDRTGGHREKIFSKAVEQLNLLQPEFVLSVGDLIEGYITDRDKLNDQWKEFQGFVAKLQMPFFYVPGNHDVTNAVEEKLWEEKFGRRYYSFDYKGVLFLILNSDDPAASSKISKTQIKFVQQTLTDNPSSRWTIVSIHKPIWTGDNAKNGWGEVEKLLAGRNYTVFAGHVHRYQKFVRNGMNYYQLATTGGGSRLRGVRYGEFDHLTWVTMKANGPIIANLMLDGILPEDLRLPETTEPVTVLERKPTHPVRGYVYLEGAPASGATVSFYLRSTTGKKGFAFAGDAIVEGDGSFAMNTYGLGDGSPVGEYAVTVAYDGRYGPVGDKKGWIPEAYGKADTSPLAVTVKSGKNDVVLELKK